MALDRVAGPAGAYEVLGILGAFANARMYEVDGHNEIVLEDRRAIQPAITACVMVPLENPVSFFGCQGLGQAAQAERTRDWHRNTSKRRSRYCPIMLPQTGKEKRSVGQEAYTTSYFTWWLCSRIVTPTAVPRTSAPSL